MSSSALPSTATAIQGSPVEANSSKNIKIGHPLDPLSSDEIYAISLTVRHHIASETSIKAIKFITLYLLPPPKKLVLAFLGIPLTPGGDPEKPSEIVRRAEVDFLDVLNGRAYNVLVSFKGSKWVIDTFQKLAEDLHPQISVEELIACEKIVRNDPKVQKLAKDVGVLPEQIFCDGWSIGYDERFPQSRRIQQAIVFARFSEHDNLYAHPMDFVPIIDANLEEVLHIDFPPTYSTNPSSGAVELSVKDTHPPALSEDALLAVNRARIPPPLASFDFLPDLRAQTDPTFKERANVKPLHIVQPEGVSFKMAGHELEWQKWKMHIAFSHREGIAISTITYDDNGQIRPIFYRLSLAEMVVPYGAPESPHPRKVAFDSGEYGMGTMANELSLGCDCLGQIHYLPGSYVAHDGHAIVIKNVICIHEEDAGVLWKHTDYRPGGRSQTVRSRRLVISMVCTLANYEYIWNYFFYQDGSIEFEIRLTGILQAYVQGPTEPTAGNLFGTIVAPGVIAHHHQHLFSIRIDPMIDGLSNSFVESDIVPLPEAPTDSESNYAGNAFVSVDKVLQTEREGGERMFDWSKERRWRIVNRARKHYASGNDVGYTIGAKGAWTPLMAREDGWAAKRAKFSTKPIWVCRDEEGKQEGSLRMWPSGKYVPQTRGEPGDSIGEWTKGDGKIDDEDILVWLTIGTTHIPRPEDWPVMPVDHLRVTFKPQSFFTVNPSMDVPGTQDAHSVAAFAASSTSQNRRKADCCT